MPVTRRRVLETITAGSIAVGLAGCTGGGSDDGGGGGDGDTPTQATSDTPPVTPGSSGETTTVEMVDTTFDPKRVSVEPGTTVRWVNEDGFGHDVTAAQFHDSAADWSFSESVGAGGSVTRTFEESGIYEYYCTIHGRGTMCGVVLVGDASLDGSLPCGSGGGGTPTDGDTPTDDGGGGGGYY